MKKNGVDFKPSIATDPRDQLWMICANFIDDLGIGCPETIYQSDRVVLSAQEFIERVCDVVGYAKFVEEAGDEIDESSFPKPNWNLD